MSKRSFRQFFKPGKQNSQPPHSMQGELPNKLPVELFSEVTLKIRQSLQLKDILHTTVTEVQRVLQADRVLIYHLLPDGRGKIVDEAVLQEYPALINLEFPEEVFPVDYRQLYAQGRIRAIANVHHPASGLTDCLVKFVDQFGIKAKLVVPIVQPLKAQAQGSPLLPNLWGLLIAHQCHSGRQWVEFELELMQQLARQIGLTLSQSQRLEQLEAEVEARTAELKAVNRALQQEMSDRQAKDEFIAVVSHELRTPLTSLHSALKILVTGRLGNLSPEGQQMLAIADENTERLIRLVNNVLDLQRIESGKVEMHCQECSAADLLTQAAAAMQPMAQQHGVTLITQPEDIFVWADADYILQALTNLLSNAIKFSSPGSSVWLTVTHIPTDEGAIENAINRVSPPLPIPHSPFPTPHSPFLTPHSSPPTPFTKALFRIRDQGQGIPADQLERVFEWFQQVDPSDSRKRGGTGLGLAICRKIIEQHNGKIWAESTPGNGSTFSFTLPALHRVNRKPGQD